MRYNSREAHRATYHRKFYDEKLNNLEIMTKDLEIGVNRFLAIGFSGKRTKSDFYYHFKTLEERENFIQKYIKKFSENLELINKHKEERKLERVKMKDEFKNKLQVGSILYDTWGYEQTNVEFYKVISINGSQVGIQELGHKDIEQTSWASCYVMPDLESKGRILIKRIGAWGVKVDSCVTLRLWDGKRVYKSWYA